MFSYNKEQSHGDHHNTIYIVMRERQLSLEDAFKWGNQRHRIFQEKFLRNLASMLSWGEDIDAQIDRYIQGLGYMVKGNVEFSIFSRRYSDGREGTGLRDNRIFELLPTAVVPTNRQLPTLV
jgi:hypothetical protein